MNIRNTKQWKEVGGLSTPSKMPCWSYSLPTRVCITGSKLRKIKGSVCFKCYASHGRYRFPNVQNALERRLKTITKDNWVENMVFLIQNGKYKYFRWHDSGDIQSLEHLRRIISIAKQCPEVKFWLPTKEIKLVKSWKSSGGKVPENLCIRFSAPMEEEMLPPKHGPSSMVVKNTESIKHKKEIFLCESFKTGGKCGDCRACWDKNVAVIAYKKH